MSFKKTLIVASLIFFQSMSATAAVATPDQPPGFWRQVGEGFASPVTTDAKYVLIGGSVLTVALVAFSDHAHEVGQHWLETKPLGGASKYGEVAGQLVPNIIYFLSMAGVSLFSDDHVYYQRASLMLQTTLYAGVATTVLKYAVHEQRPDSGNHDSFPSGHTTTAFAFASAVAMEHEWYYGVPAYMLATLTGLSRVNDGHHFVHDVIAGATLGISYGMGTYYTMTRNKTLTAANSMNAWQFAFAPDEHLSGGMFIASGSF